MVPGTTHPSGAPTQQQARVRTALRDRARKHGLRVSFGDGRRATDVTLVVVKGPRTQVMRAYPALVDGLGLDVEMVRSASTLEAFEMVMALTAPRRQRRRVAVERRASERGGG